MKSVSRSKISLMTLSKIRGPLLEDLFSRHCYACLKLSHIVVSHSGTRACLISVGAGYRKTVEVGSMLTISEANIRRIELSRMDRRIGLWGVSYKQ
jgi:hypothetical protein